MLLVIGITGHTGKYFLRELKENNYTGRIRFLIRNKNDENIFKKYNLNYEVMYGDLNNKEDIQNACKGIDTILEIYNIRYSLDVLDAALNENVKRIIFVHTTGIYSKYKMASEEYKRIEKEVIKKAKEKIDITILRPTMIYGDICDHNISKFIKMMDKMKIYPLIAGGRAKIQPVNARDLGRAYYQVLVNDEKTKNQDYNLSGEEPISIKDMLKNISYILNKKTLFIPIPLYFSVFCAYILKILTLGKINIVEKVLRMDEDRCFDNSKAREDFGYTTIDFQKGLKEEIRQYKEKQARTNATEKKAIILTTVPSTIEQFNMENIKLLKKLGYKVEVASNFNVTGNIDENRLEAFKNELRNIGVKITNISFSRRLSILSNLKSYFQLKKIFKTEKYELIHCHTPICSAITRLASRKLRKRGTKVIYTAHGFHFYKEAPVLNWMIYYPIEKICARWTDCLITINEEDYNLAKTKFKAKEVRFINGVGVDENKFNFTLADNEKVKIRQELNLRKEDFVLIQVGELNKNKNQIMTIEAMKEIVKENKKIKLLLVGKGKLKDFYEKKIKEYNLENNIFLLGYRRDIPSLLKISNCLISTSKREGLPVNLIEAAMSGLPIIATNCRGNRDIAKKVVDIDDIKGLCENITACTENKEKYICTDIDKYKLENIMKEMGAIYNNEK